MYVTTILKRLGLAAALIAVCFFAVASYQANPSSLSFFVSGCVVAGFGALVLWRNPRSAQVRAFFLLSLAYAGHIFLVYLLHLAKAVGIDAVKTPVWVLRNGLFMIPVSTIYFTGYFLGLGRRARLALSWLAMLSMLPFVVLNACGLYVTEYQLAGETYIPANALDAYRRSAIVTLLWLFAAALLVAIGCLRRSSRGRRAQYVLFLVGWSFSTFLATLGYRTAFRSNWFPSFSGITWLIFPATLGFAVARFSLFDIRIVIRRTLPYAVGTALIGAAYALAWRGIEQVSGRLDIHPRGLQWIALLVLVGLIFQPVLEALRDGLDRLFFRTEAELDRFLAGAAARYAEAEDRRALAKIVARDAAEELKLEGAAVLLGGEAVEVAEAYGPGPVPERARGLARPVDLAANEPLAADGSGLIPLGTPDGPLAAALGGWSAALAVPFGDASGGGLLVCREKRSHLAFSPRDRMFLAALAAQAGIALSRLEAHREAAAARRLTAAFFDAMTNPVALLDSGGLVLSANVAFVTTFRIDPGQRLPPVARDLLFDAGLLAGPAEVETPHGAFLCSVKRLEGRADERLAVLTDVTELRRLRDADRRRAALAEVGATVASINHEIGNILAPLDFHLQKAHRLAAGDESLRTWEKVRERIRAMEALSRELRNFYKEPELVLQRVDLGGVLGAVLADLRSSAGPEWVAPCLEGVDVALRADPAKLKQVMLNLLKNAWEAMSEGGERRWGVRARVENGLALIEVHNTGPGIPPGLIGRLFQPFFTTKKGRGTGLGLAISRRIVTAHKGDISIRSEPGRETVVELQWPAAAATASSTAP